MKTLVALDEQLLNVMLRALVHYRTDLAAGAVRDCGRVVKDDETGPERAAVVDEAMRQIAVSLDLLAQAKAGAAPKR